MRRPWPALGRSTTGGGYIYIYIYIYRELYVHWFVHRVICLNTYPTKCRNMHLFISASCSTCFMWKYHPKHVEQFADINKLYIVSSCWIIIETHTHTHTYIYIYREDSLVGIAADYGLDGPGSNTGGDEIFHPSIPALGPTQSPVKWVQGLSRG